MTQKRIINPTLLICDIQERFRSEIYAFDKVVSTAQKMIKAAQILNIPIIATTQNRRALGETVSELGLDSLTDPSLLKTHADKKLFSMCIPEVLDLLPNPKANETSATANNESSTNTSAGASAGASTNNSTNHNATSLASAVLIVGIESHICVTQTTLDLLARGHAVYVLADGVSSCNREEIPIALRRLASKGATVTTSESILFEIMGDAAIPEFKEVAGLVRGWKEDTRKGLGELCKI